MASIIAALPSSTYAQDADPAALLGISAATHTGTALEAFMYGQPAMPYLMLGTANLQHIAPLAWGTAGAWANAGIQLGLDALWVGLTVLKADTVASTLGFNAAHKYSMFASYAGYANLRARSTDPDYAQGMDAQNFLDLALAPFKPSSYTPWPVWGYLASMGAFALLSSAGSDSGLAVWDSGVAYIGEREYPAWLGITLMLAAQIPNFIMTGVGEEALFRGAYYEEMSERWGEWPAKLADAFFFTASHWPQQWSRIKEQGPLPFLLKTALSFGQAFWFQYIYEWHGLQAAVTAHAASDIIVFFCDWVYSGGEPTPAGFSINDRGF